MWRKKEAKENKDHEGGKENLKKKTENYYKYPQRFIEAIASIKREQNPSNKQTYILGIRQSSRK